MTTEWDAKWFEAGLQEEIVRLERLVEPLRQETARLRRFVSDVRRELDRGTPEHALVGIRNLLTTLKYDLDN